MLSLFDVMEQVQVMATRRPPEGTALLPIPMELVSLWERADWDVPARGTARLVVVFPDGQMHDPVEMDIDLSTAPRHRSRIKFPGIPFRAPGVTRFAVSVRFAGQEDWIRVANLPLHIELPGMANAATTPA